MKKHSFKLSQHIVEDMIDPILTKNCKNRAVIKQMFLTLLNPEQIETLLEIIYHRGVYTPLKQGDYVKLKPKSYWEGEIYERDRLKDLGLLSDDEIFSLYGQIIHDGDWSDDNFNPFFETMKVKIYLYDEDTKKMFKKEEKISISDLQVIEKSSIKYYTAKSKKNGTIINESISSGVQHLEKNA